MPRYCITMEQTHRIAVRFDADDDHDAEVMAQAIHERTDDGQYASGDVEHDYELVREDDSVTVVPWSR